MQQKRCSVGFWHCEILKSHRLQKMKPVGDTLSCCIYVKSPSVKVTQLSSVQAHNPCRLCVRNAFIYGQLRSTAKNFAFSPGKPTPSCSNRKRCGSGIVVVLSVASGSHLRLQDKIRKALRAYSTD